MVIPIGAVTTIPVKKYALKRLKKLPFFLGFKTESMFFFFLKMTNNPQFQKKKCNCHNFFIINIYDKKMFF